MTDDTAKSARAKMEEVLVKSICVVECGVDAIRKEEQVNGVEKSQREPPGLVFEEGSEGVCMKSASTNQWPWIGVGRMKGRNGNVSGVSRAQIHLSLIRLRSALRRQVRIDVEKTTIRDRSKGTFFLIVKRSGSVRQQRGFAAAAVVTTI